MAVIRKQGEQTMNQPQTSAFCKFHNVRWDGMIRRPPTSHQMLHILPRWRKLFSSPHSVSLLPIFSFFFFCIFADLEEENVLLLELYGPNFNNASNQLMIIQFTNEYKFNCSIYNWRILHDLHLIIKVLVKFPSHQPCLMELWFVCMEQFQFVWAVLSKPTAGRRQHTALWVNSA